MGQPQPFSNPIVEAGVLGLAELFEQRAVTPVEATETYLSRIERLNGSLGAVTCVDKSRARQAARRSAARWTAGKPLSRVDGVPVLVKSNIAVAGLPWTAGVGAYRERLAEADAACVARLKAQGAVILGLVNMHEGALGAITDNAWFGRTHNPHRHGFTAGGSSGGSGAAVAAGFCAAALGTDTMGSVRIPSAYCGVFGHKPTYGLIPTEGVVELSWTLDHVGVHARSAADCAAVLEASMRGPKPACTTPPADNDRPLAVLEFEGEVEVARTVRESFEGAVEAAQTAGWQVERLRLPDYDFGRMRRLGLLISEAEGYVVHEAALAAGEGFSDTFRGLLEWGARQPASKLARAYLDVRTTAARVRTALAPYAGLLAPTAPQTAFPFGEAPPNQADFTALADFIGWPATAFPRSASDGLPLSAQVVCEEDQSALAIASALARPVGAPPDFRG